jgi:hypothetical protein
MQTAIQAPDFITNPDRYLTPAEVEAMTGRKQSTLAKDRINRRGIPFYKMGRIIRYHYQDVVDYLKHCRIETDD